MTKVPFYVAQRTCKSAFMTRPPRRNGVCENLFDDGRQAETMAHTS